MHIAPKLLIYSDAGMDTDDEMALLLAAQLQRSSESRIMGVIGAGRNAGYSARLCKGTLSQVGVEAPVGFRPSHQTEIQDEPPYLSTRNELVDAARLQIELLEKCSPGEAVLVCNAALTELKNLIRHQRQLFARTVGLVVIMGGVQTDSGGEPSRDEQGLLSPDTAANNVADLASARFVYSELQKMQVPLKIVSRFAAYACPFSPDIFVALAQTKHLVGRHLFSASKRKLNNLWRLVNQPKEMRELAGLPERCDVQWFSSMFLRDTPTISDADIWKFVQKIYLYDALSVSAAVPAVSERFFSPIRIDSTEIIGTRKKSGVQNPSQLTEFIGNACIQCLQAT